MTETMAIQEKRQGMLRRVASVAGRGIWAVVRTRGRESFFQSPPAATLLIVIVLAYVVLFSAWSILSYRNYHFTAYDAGIHDQAVWKLATGRGLFNTIRGLPIWGDHCWFIMLLMAPFFWIAPHLETLLILQAVALGAAAIPLATLAYRRTASRWIALMLAAAWLLNPALQRMNMENLHPEVIAAAFLIWALSAADARRWGWYGVALGLALLCKEDIALTAFVLGFWIMLRRSGRAGIITMIVCVAYFLFCMKVFLPWMNGSGFFRFSGGYWFSGWWAHKTEAAYYYNTFGKPEVIQYIWQLGAPLLFLCLLEPLLCLAVLPGLVVNILGGGYLLSIKYHYNYHTLPMLFGALAIGLGQLRAKVRLGRFWAWGAAAAVLAASVYFNQQWSGMPLRKTAEHPGPKTAMKSLYTGWRESNQRKGMERLMALLPQDPDIPIAASHGIVTQLSHRNQIYMFPNPWQAHYWGINGENLPSPARVQAIMVEMGGEFSQIVNRLLKSGEFEVIGQEGRWLVARRGLSPEEAAERRQSVSAESPGGPIQIQVFSNIGETTNLMPVEGRKPDYEVQATVLGIPQTHQVLKTADGVSLEVMDNAQARFSGTWQALGKRPVRFRVRADDGCRLYIDDEMVVDFDGTHAFGESKESGPVRLSIGNHRIVVDYLEWGGEAGLRVEWAKEGGAFKELESGDVLP